MSLLPFDRMNRIHLGDCVYGMRGLPDGCIPLTVTSPPYGNLRKYGGHPLDFEAVAQELWRVTAPGGVVVWVVADHLEGGTETGAVCRQQLCFQDLGFLVHDKLVMAKNYRFRHKTRYSGDCLEFALVLSKGRPRSVNLLRDKRNLTAGRRRTFTQMAPDGRRSLSPKQYTVSQFGVRGKVWFYPRGGRLTTSDRVAFGQTAPMPEAMARDHILSWSRPGDLVLDPFLGSGTTAKMALLSDRRYLGYEVYEPYFEIAEQRLADARAEYRRRLDKWLTAAVGWNRSSGTGL
jgi:site-specific DNA-methyltransferase (adenine-specific)